MDTPTISDPMARALELAREVLGRSSPNPAVGAVLMQRGRIVGEGATQPPGGPHAEVVAIRNGGPASAGATLYVSLEPCSTHGRTPPCTEAIVAASIREVVVAMNDPDPAVDGAGLLALRQAGIAVASGDGAAEALRHYEAYIHHRRSGRPFVIAKYAASLDGKIAATGGDSRWVSSPETRAWAHRLRPQIDAILVGVETVIQDDPLLTARPDGRTDGVAQPLRIVLDSHGRTPPTARLLGDQDLAHTLIVTTPDAPDDWRAQIEAAGASILELPAAAGRVALEPLLDRLGHEYGIVSLLVEGGGQVHGAFFDQGLVDKVHAIIAPMIIGGDAAVAVAGRGAATMADVVRLQRLTVERIGDDLLVTGYPLAAPPSAAVTLRPAGTGDAAALGALLDAMGSPPAAGADATVARALERALQDQGGIWVAVQEDRVVGGAALTFLDPDWATRADGRQVAALTLLLVSPEWRGHGLAARLVETAEASAEGRGFRWLTAPAGPLADAAGFTHDQRRRRGFRYYRRTPDGRPLAIKQLAPDPGVEASRARDGAGSDGAG